jgi:gluconate 2-dehydrogenase gamma chain
MAAISRRSFLKAAGASAASLAASCDRTPQQAATTAATTYAFFDAEDAAFVEAAVARLIPSDDSGPGALEAGVPVYIDRQLAGAWGAGERLYRSGPWQTGQPSQGYQLPFTPAELFRNALRAIHDGARASGAPAFATLSPADQDAYLKALESEPRDLGGVPSNVFFESLLELTIEGFFSDPVYGGNRDMVGWKLIGFPGAYANYYEFVDQHGVRFQRPPTSLGQDARGTVHLLPASPQEPHPASAPHPSPRNKA